MYLYIYICIYIFTSIHIYIYADSYFPTCQVTAARFYQGRLLLLLLLLLLLANPLCQVCRQSSSPSFSSILFASSGSQCAPLDLIPPGPIAVCTSGLHHIRQLRIALSTAGPHPPGSERSVHRWIAVCTCTI